MNPMAGAQGGPAPPYSRPAAQTMQVNDPAGRTKPSRNGAHCLGRAAESIPAAAAHATADAGDAAAAAATTATAAASQCSRRSAVPGTRRPAAKTDEPEPIPAPAAPLQHGIVFAESLLLRCGR